MRKINLSKIIADFYSWENCSERIWKLKNMLFRIFNISFWSQIYPINWEYDKQLREAIDNQDYSLFKFKTYDLLTNSEKTNSHKDSDINYIRVGKFSLWMSNYPYAYGRPSSAPLFAEDGKSIVVFGETNGIDFENLGKSVSKSVIPSPLLRKRLLDIHKFLLAERYCFT